MAGSDLRRWAQAKNASASLGEKIYGDLAEDFPATSREWVRRVPWSGPKDVPISQIDFSNQENWRASHELDKVDDFGEKIANGWRKPVILVKKPGSDKATVIDGHHRALAFKQEGKPVFAYVASPSQAKGPWDEMHAAQYHAKSGSVSSTKA